MNCSSTLASEVDYKIAMQLLRGEVEAWEPVTERRYDNYIKLPYFNMAPTNTSSPAYNNSRVWQVGLHRLYSSVLTRTAMHFHFLVLDPARNSA